MDLNAYHSSDREMQRVQSLMRMLPAAASVLDIGARDGYLSKLLADRILRVTALDLAMPEIDDARIECVAADAAKLPFPDNHFDVVFCAEVLEHIPEPALSRACVEIARVAKGHVLIGVPYRQDIRHGRTTCSNCGQRNPPWGHVNSFDETRLGALFPALALQTVEYVGTGEAGTNALSAWLMDRAGNPFGTYAQDERCIHCNARILPPPARTFIGRVCSRLAVVIREVQVRLHKPRANWIHVRLAKPPASAPHAVGA